MDPYGSIPCGRYVLKCATYIACAMERRGAVASHDDLTPWRDTLQSDSSTSLHLTEAPISKIALYLTDLRASLVLQENLQLTVLELRGILRMFSELTVASAEGPKVSPLSTCLNSWFGVPVMPVICNA